MEATKQQPRRCAPPIFHLPSPISVPSPVVPWSRSPARRAPRPALCALRLALCALRLAPCAFVALLLGSATAGRAQDALRMSMASAEAAEGRRKAATTIGYYNLHVGPTAWRFGAGLGLQFNDNVNLSQNNPQSDLALTPQINTEMLWPITDKNAINLTVGVGYSAYVQHPELDRIFVAPGTELSFDLYVGDFWFNFHDRISITQNAYQDPTVTGTGSYSQLQNALGASALWDLNKVILRSGYDHVNYLALAGSGGQPNGQSELFSASAGYALRPGAQLGIELGGGLLHYSGASTTFTDASQWSAGCFYETQLSQYIHCRGSVGYTVYSPEAPGSLPVVPGSSRVLGDFSGIYAQLDVAHRLNAKLDYTLSGGRSINFGLFGGAVDMYFARLAANWNLLRKFALGTTFSYEHGSQLNTGTETFDRFGPGLTLGHTITSKLSGSLGYQYYWRGSSLPGREYTANIVSLNFSYRF